MNVEFIYRQVGKDAMYRVWHEHDGVMIYYAYSDGGSVATLDGVYPIERGTLLYVGQNCLHYTLPDPPEKYDRSKILISKEKFFTLLALCSGDGFNTIFKSGELLYVKLSSALREEVETLLSNTYENLTGKEDDAIILSASIKLLSIIKKHSKTATISKKVDPVAGAITYINEHIYENITLEDICKASFLSKFYFCRKFKSATNLTVLKYVLITKIELSKNLLKQTDLSISEISDKMCFSSVSFYSSAFKKHVGISPLSYRKNNKQ